jgi:hypothetical protein
MPLTPEQKYNQEPIKAEWRIVAKMKRGDAPVIKHAFDQYLSLMDSVMVEEFTENLEDI